jgi:hypothetical protein
MSDDSVVDYNSTTLSNDIYWYEPQGKVFFVRSLSQPQKDLVVFAFGYEVWGITILRNKACDNAEWSIPLQDFVSEIVTGGVEGA